MRYEERVSGVNQILDIRQDMTKFLFHFTKGPHAFETLCKIISSKKLKDINDNGQICFTEAPLNFLIPLFKYFEDSYPHDPMYAPYGIGFSKKSIFKAGGRPVIYGLEEEKALLSEDIHWRFQKMDFPIPNYSWLREWRINKKSINLNPKNFFIITKTKEENLLLTHRMVDNSPSNYDNDGAFIIEREYIGISLDEINSSFSDQTLLQRIKEQLLDL